MLQSSSQQCWIITRSENFLEVLILLKFTVYEYFSNRELVDGELHSKRNVNRATRLCIQWRSCLLIRKCSTKLASNALNVNQLWDLETMQHCKGPFIASHILSSYSRQKETMTRGLDVSSIRHNGTDTDEKLEALLLTRVSFTTTKMWQLQITDYSSTIDCHFCLLHVIWPARLRWVLGQKRQIDLCTRDY